MPSNPAIHNDAHAVFEILVRENADMLTAYLRSVVWNSAAVDDLFQETMLTAWRKLGEYDRGRPFGPWLRGIAARLVLAHMRKRKRDVMVCDEAVLDHLDRRMEQLNQSAGDTLAEKLGVLRQCIERLPEPHRRAIDLRYLEQRSADDAAAELHITLEAFKKRLQRARAMLLQCLQRKHVFTASGS